MVEGMLELNSPPKQGPGGVHLAAAGIYLGEPGGTSWVPRGQDEGTVVSGQVP